MRNDSKYGLISEVDRACHCGCRDGLRASPERKPDRFVICHLVKSSNWMGEAAGFRMDKQLFQKLAVYMICKLGF